MKPVTLESLQKANYAELTKFCKQLGVLFQNQPKERLKELLLARINTLSEQSPTPTIKGTSKKISDKKPIPVPKTQKASKGHKEEKETKSNKILALHLKGIKVSEISKTLNAHPSFCYTVIKKYKDKQ
jgi:hypothetical protein